MPCALTPEVHCFISVSLLILTSHCTFLRRKLQIFSPDLPDFVSDQFKHTYDIKRLHLHGLHLRNK